MSKPTLIDNLFRLDPYLKPHAKEITRRLYNL